MAEKLDIIIFGASGFTGKFTVYEAVTVLKDLKWGIAGRNKEKLKCVLSEMGGKAKTDLSNIPIVIADINDLNTLTKMAEKCKVLVNCCGPYRFYGEAVVKVCIQTGTHHVDVSGEPQYMETMQLKYNDLARENGVYVISACGFDSIPADLGTVFLEKNFNGVVNSVETYLESWESGGSTGGAAIHYGTWESAVFGLAHADELRDIRSKLFPVRLPQFQPKLKNNSIIHKSAAIDLYCLPFPGSDRSVVMRSQRIMYENEKKRPIQMKTYVGFRSLVVLIGVTLFAILFGILTRFSLGRSILLKFPKLFSFGMVSRQGPIATKMEKTRFALTLVGEGWSKDECLCESTDQYKSSPTKKMIIQITGKNPGYGATCVALLVSAITILKENDKIPFSGGVLPPGAAFAKTNMIEELMKYENGMQFKILSI